MENKEEMFVQCSGCQKNIIHIKGEYPNNMKTLRSYINICLSCFKAYDKKDRRIEKALKALQD